MQDRTLFVKIKLELLGSDLIIEDADISIELKKTDEEKYNYCDVTIYNLADDTYNLINNKTTSMAVYTDICDTGYSLLFKGNLRNLQKRKKAKKTTKKKTSRKSKTTSNTQQIHYNEPAIRREDEDSDIVTIISLEDGINNYYLDNYVSKSYSGAVTNKYILNDIFKNTQHGNIEISANLDDLVEKTYPRGKVVQGSFKYIVANLAKDGGCNCKINNNILLIRKNEIQDSSYAYTLDSTNCPKPEPETDKKIKILAPFLPTINPLDQIMLDFKDYKGVYKVKSIETKVDNFGKEYETEVIVADK